MHARYYRASSVSLRPATWLATVAGLVILLTLVSPARAGIIVVTPTSAVAQNYYTPDNRSPICAINGSGMTPSNPVTVASTCGTAPGNTMWLSNNTKPTWIAFDLGATYTLAGFHLWNYNENSGNPGLFTLRGVQNVDVRSGTAWPPAGAGTNWGTLAESYTSMTQATGAAAYAGEDYSFATPLTTRYVQFYVNSNWGSELYTGISEVRFIGVINDWTNSSGNGRWNDTANWFLPLLPQNGDNVARFLGSSSGTVTVDNSLTIGQIDFDNAAAYTIAASPGQSLTLSRTGGALINAIHGIHTIAAPLVLGTNTTISGGMSISGDISGAGALAISGAGSFVVLSGANTYGGGTTVNAGTLQVSSAAAIPGTGRNVTPGANTVVAAGYAIDNAFLQRLPDSVNTAFTVALAANSSNNLDFSSAAGAKLSGASLGAVGAATYSGTLTPNGTYYRLGGGGGTLTLSQPSALTGARGLVVGGAGGGVVVLGASNDYTGGTILNGSTLSVSADSQFGGPNSGVTFNGGTLRITGTEITNLDTHMVNWPAFNGGLDIADANHTFTVSQNIEGGGALTKAGAGTLLLTGSNTHAGGTTLRGGYLSVAGDVYLGTGTLNFNGGALRVTGSEFTSTALAINWGLNGGGLDIVEAANTFTVSQTLTGSGGLTKTGPGTLLLTGASSYTGPTTVSAGALVLRDTGSFNSDINNNAAVTFDSSATWAGAWWAFSKTITGTGSVTKTNGGVLSLSGDNSYSGGTTVSNGILAMQHPNAAGTGPITLAEGTYVCPWWGNTLSPDIANDFILNGLGATQSGYPKDAIYADGNTGTVYNLTGTITLNKTSNLGGHPGNGLTVSGKITGPGGLVKGGGWEDTCTLTLVNPDNDFAGDTTVDTGTVKLGAAEVLPHGAGKGNLAVNIGTVVANGSSNVGTLDLNGFDETVNGFSGNGRVTNTGLNPSTFTVGANNADGTFSGTITNGASAVSLAKTGSGTQVLAGAHTYTGNTVITGGTLKLAPARTVALPESALWLDASKPDTVHVDEFSGQVFQWDDVSGKGRNAVSNAGQIAGAYADKAVSFDGFTQSLAVPVEPGTFANGFSLFVVAQKTGESLNGYDALVTRNPDGSNLPGPWDVWSRNPAPRSRTSFVGNGTTYTAFGNVGIDIATLTSRSVVSFLGSSSHVLQAVNAQRVMDVTGAFIYGDDAAWNIFLGTRGDGFTRLNGNISEVLIYDRFLTDEERQSVENQLLLKWGLPVSSVLPAGTAVQIAHGATLDLNGGNQQIASLADYPGGTGGVVTNGAADIPLTLTLAVESDTARFSGNIEGGTGKGAISLVKSGGGTQVLAGVNTYTGGTTVQAGTLEIASASALPGGRSLTIEAAGTVVLRSELTVGAGQASSAQPVPEPASIVLLLATLAIVAGRAAGRTGRGEQ